MLIMNSASQIRPSLYFYKARCKIAVSSCRVRYKHKHNNLNLYFLYRVIALEREQLSEDSQKSLKTAEVGVKCLDLVPHPWKERLKPLVQHPWLQLESLVMVQQFDAAAELLANFPQLEQ